MGSSADFEVWDLASRQDGYITRSQALAVGMSETMIRTRLRSGHWRRIQPGVYLLAGRTESLRGLVAVACASLGGVASHETAAEIHGLANVRRGQAVVTVAVRRTHAFSGVRVHQSTDLIGDDIADSGPLPVTTVARTIVDLAAVVRPKRLDRIVERALADELCRLDDLVALAARVARKGKPGTVAMREVLERRRSRTVLTESELEYRLLRLFEDWGLPTPELQMELPWRSDRRGRVDFAFQDQRVIVEADGRPWHSTVEAFDSDRKRDNLAQLAGWRVIRVTWRMLDRDADLIRQTLTELLGLRPTA